MSLERSRGADMLDFGEFEELLKLDGLGSRVESAFRHHYANSIIERRATFAPITRVTLARLPDEEHPHRYSHFDQETQRPVIYLDQQRWSAFEALSNGELDRAVASEVEKIATRASFHSIRRSQNDRIYCQVIAELCDVKSPEHVVAFLRGNTSDSKWPGEDAVARLNEFLSFTEHRTLGEIVVASADRVLNDADPPVLATLLHQTTLCLDATKPPVDPPPGVTVRQLEKARNGHPKNELAAYLVNQTEIVSVDLHSHTPVFRSAVARADAMLRRLKSTVAASLANENMSKALATTTEIPSTVDDTGLDRIFKNAAPALAQLILASMRNVPDFIASHLAGQPLVTSDRLIREELELNRSGGEPRDATFVRLVIDAARSKVHTTIRAVQAEDSAVLPADISELLLQLPADMGGVMSSLFGHVAEEVRRNATALSVVFDDVEGIVGKSVRGRHYGYRDEVAAIRESAQHNSLRLQPQPNDPVESLKNALRAHGDRVRGASPGRDLAVPVRNEPSIGPSVRPFPPNGTGIRRSGSGPGGIAPR